MATHTLTDVADGNDGGNGSSDAGDSNGADVVGIDVGGTKTHLAAARDGRITREATVPTSTWRTADPARDGEALAALIGEHLGAGALAWPTALGVHGCDSTEHCLALQGELAKHLSGPVRVVNDAELMPWATGIHGGIGVVAGTGSIAVARDAGDRLVTSGGWGWVLGDEGGAAGIVREAVRAVLADLDGGGSTGFETGGTGDGHGGDREPDPLTAALLAGFEVTTGPGLAMALTRRSSADWWGSRAGLVFDAADAGSPAAARVIDEAGGQLAALVVRLLERGVEADHVVAGGSVIVAQARLRDRFLDVLAAARPDVAVSVLSQPPVLGALALAGSLAPACRAA